MPTIAQNQALIKHLAELLAAHRPLYRQKRVYGRVVGLLLGEGVAFGRHTVTQLVWVLGMSEVDWSAWYRVFSRGYFQEEASARVVLGESLRHVGAEEVYVVAGDGTQTPRSSGKMEGVGWQRNRRTPVFMVGIHWAQRWFNGSWLIPAENGYSRAVPLRWMPAFTEKAKRKVQVACTEWEAAIAFLSWLKGGLATLGRPQQRILMVADGSYDTLAMWQHLPAGVWLLVRSAKNRVLHHLPPVSAHGNRKYGERALTPQQCWLQRQGWRKTRVLLRGKQRDLQYRVAGAFLRKGAPDTPLLLIIVRGQTYTQHGRRKQREPLPLLVNAHHTADQTWDLPLPIEQLLFWAWQRWEIEVCHRELKSNFGLGDKQCWNPHAAIASVQWSAWVYALLLLAGYRTWGLTRAPPIPTRWWQGAPRWSFNTLLRAFRAAFWGPHLFQPLWSAAPTNWLENFSHPDSLFNAAFASSQL